MLLQTTIDMKVGANNITYWKNKGYLVELNRIATVNVKDLPKKSNMMVKCLCESCNMEYMQRYSRDFVTCGKCKNRNRMLGNKLGEKQRKYDTPDKNTLIGMVNDQRLSKTEISNHYNVTIPVVNRWIKECGINVDRHYGRKFFKTKNEETDAISLINTIHKEVGISELSRMTGIPKKVIDGMRKSGKIERKTQFDLWQTAYDHVQKNIDFFVSENKTKNLKQISEENNISLDQLKNCFRDNNIQVKLHSYNKSRGEIECRDYIRNLSVDCFSAMIEKKYEIDCYVPSEKFGVEYCGEYWHRYDKSKANKYYHRNKQIFCDQKGINIITVFASEWETKKDIVKSMINSRLGKNKRIFARKCRIVEITKAEAEQFHKKNHISGSTNSKLNIALFYEDVVVGVLSLIKSRFSKAHEYEISRFSTLLNHNVVGGLGKLFSYFVDKHNPTSCVTYSDLRFGAGKSYMKIGFKYIGKTPPNYYYYSKKSTHLESRMKYQKHKLKNMPEFDVNLTEGDIMEKAGYFRVYDCGNKKYEWIK